ncbi:MAG: tRNA guanosine(34) transglycosylase Tgt [Acidobacteria bacterium]|nr:MAG: tRNA guanosine(34) transglycosylase Tgt [Acidobacteriota bacterium]REK01923.1 MAG: tRNA guanosine(34) transglycosylase Tgt [Acidobacteriota bacterium]REK14879.1 MAG: tRNA guanosine(34) transglycosylase Tgt [Acidobacteriota bacterium]REK45594.1 MAG: tRNA guanosine(34) transglycosylase Tgt [Acidobacteriota bacterium]
MQAINWKTTARDGNARTGVIQTRRSVIETPVFMPVGTLGTVKGERFEWLESEIDARIILGNTYHLWIRPGTDVITVLGGLHRFSGWNRALLTDSGGFQVFSLSELRRIGEEGVEFRSHLDGAKLFMSPEISMDIQAVLGSEIVMAFDECPPGDLGKEEIKTSVDLTVRWAQRSKDRFEELQAGGSDLGRVSFETSDLSGKQALFGIVQGGGHLDLRKESLERTVEIGFDGYAIGGLSVGEEKDVMYGVLGDLAPQMPESEPRYLMGVGTPEDILEAVSHGVDMFDCVLPTRNGRTGGAFTSNGDLNIRNATFRDDPSPLDENCKCSVCRRHSRAYIRHLYTAKEMLGPILISHHNLAYYLGLMADIRTAIREQRFSAFRAEVLAHRSAG